MEERRNKRLCHYCDVKFHMGHRCSRSKLFLLEGLEGEEGEKEEEKESLVVIQNEELLIDDKEIGEWLRISLHALVGSISPKNMRLEGTTN